MDKNAKFIPCEDSFGEDADTCSGSYKTVGEAKRVILEDLGLA